MSLSTALQQRLVLQQESLPELVKGLPDDLLKEQVIPGKWSAIGQVAHLTAYQPVFLQRVKLMEQGNSPVFQRYVAEDDPVFREYCSAPAPELLSNYHTTRFIINNHLTALPEATLRKQGVHPLFGQFSISQWTEFFLLHEAHHLFVLFTLTAVIRNRNQS